MLIYIYLSLGEFLKYQAMLKYIYNCRYHTHNLQRLPNYYLDPMPLPPEDLEPIQEKPVSYLYIFSNVITMIY